MWNVSTKCDVLFRTCPLKECSDNDLLRVVLTQRIRKCHVNYLITSVKAAKKRIIPMCKTQFHKLLQVGSTVEMSASSHLNKAGIGGYAIDCKR